VRRVDEAVHRGVYGWRGTARAVEAVIERGDHLVLAVNAGIDVDEGAQAVEPEDRQARVGECAEIAAEPLTHISSTGEPVTGSMPMPLAEVLPPA